MFDIPILIIAYKRPENILRLVNHLRTLQPAKLYIFADGPKTENEIIDCTKTREIVDLIDWECVVEKKFPAKNLGVALGPKTAIDWLFEQNEMGIILEDDIFPSLDFFSFAKEMLHKYQNHENVMHINAMNFHLGKKVVKDSYYFSCITCPWGWATWKRAWRLYDYDFNNLEKIIDKLSIPKMYKDEFIKCKKNKFTWDYQWFYSVLKNNGISIVPSKNLAMNMGFEDPKASNTHAIPIWAKKIKLELLDKIVHPQNIEINEWADELSFSYLVWNYKPRKLKYRLSILINKLFT